MLVDGASRLIPSESCAVFWMRHGSRQDIEIRAIWFSPMQKEVRWNRRNLLNGHLKPRIKKLELPPSVDFRSFRIMHSSLMSSIGVRPEVTRDNMGHSTADVTQNVYNRPVEHLFRLQIGRTAHLSERIDIDSTGKKMAFATNPSRPMLCAESTRARM